ncbi:hypothetical protein BD410DRAFT_841530 [Rickenella mellea]|uniref:RRM domain-containing protein n=1 Tax=Rickenella mellea TaxID=50990 RepID=A0A4Y7PXQ4_9AGAM|nr:hypothetical protein BD410DRAFT_841530 [Rickenella mellea]
MSRPQDDRNQEATVYLGNLDERCSDALVWELMLQAGPVVNVHLPKDRISMAHQGYGFCEFLTEEDAEYACKIMNQIKLWGIPIRVNKASSDKKQLDVGSNLFIGNLDENVDERLLYDTFSAFGILATTAKVARDPSNGQSKGYGFVSYTDFESSDAAIEAMNGQFLMNKAHRATRALPQPPPLPGFTPQQTLGPTAAPIQKGMPPVVFPTIGTVRQAESIAENSHRDFRFLRISPHDAWKWRTAGRQALGRLASLSDANFLTGQIGTLVNQVGNNCEPYGRAGCALAFGSIYRHVGGLTAGPLLKTTVNILMSLANDPHPVQLNGASSIDGVRVVTTSWLQQTVVHNPSAWIDLCQSFMSRTSASQQASDAAYKNAAPADDEGESLSVGMTQDRTLPGKGNATSRWRTQLFALQCLHITCTVVATAEGASRHPIRSTSGLGAVCVACISTSRSYQDGLYSIGGSRYRNTRCNTEPFSLTDVKRSPRVFAKSPKDAVLLEQHQTLITAALIPAFSSEPDILSSDIRVCAVFVGCGVVKAINQMSRILKLLTSAFELSAHAQG